MNSLFGLKSRNFIFILSLAFLVGCQSFNLKTRDGKAGSPTDSSGVSVSSDHRTGGESRPEGLGTSMPSEVLETEPVAPTEALPDVLVAKTPTKTIPKFAFILGPGGAKAFAHVGFLQELQSRKVPVQVISGIEWGALVAGLYAYRGSVNDVQWQLSKIKSEDVMKRNFITRQLEPGSMDQLSSLLYDAVGNSQTDKTRIPFACPSYMLARSEGFVMSRSYLREAISYCMPLPPLLSPYKGYVAHPMDIGLIAQYLRSRGANYVVYVSVLGPQGGKGANLDTSSTILWNFADQKALARYGVDASLSIPINEYSIVDIDRSREIMIKGADLSKTVLNKFLAPWGL